MHNDNATEQPTKSKLAIKQQRVYFPSGNYDSTDVSGGKPSDIKPRKLAPIDRTTSNDNLRETRPKPPKLSI